MKEQTFYDSHMHAFNLSHPSISVFVRRSLRELRRSLFRRRHLWRLAPFVLLVLCLSVLFILSCLASFVPVLRGWVRSWVVGLYRQMKRLLKSAANLLVVLENDIGSTFLLMEDCLREKENPLLQEDGLHVGGETYTHIVMTPLMMDFGYKGNQPPGEGRVRRFHYDMRAGKPIVEQVIDVFGAVRTYLESEADEKLTVKYPALRPGTERVFEIYPFLGLNPANYSLSKIAELLDKYFKDYTGRRGDFFAQMGQFDGNISHLGSHAFAGIKVYPPLGFDPWPDRDAEAMEKVELLYDTCSKKGIPLTTHGGKGGFVVVGKDELNAIADVSKWAAVLSRYSGLKLNLAHFPVGTLDRKRQRETLALVLRHENVYVDISCQATTEAYYKGLKALLEGLDAKAREKLERRILFGSDFAINLMWIESYNHYVALFSQTPSVTLAQKLAFCSANPERFLFATEKEAETPRIKA